MTIQFNISPSMVNCYNESQLIFYFSYILKKEPDTPVCEAYGRAGNVTHESLEEDTLQEGAEKFNSLWLKNNINNLRTLGRPLSKATYLDSVRRGFDVLNELKKQGIKIHKEEIVEFPLVSNKDFKINIKGIIDVWYEDNNGDLFGLDWKTSSSIAANDEGFERQAKHYMWSLYKKYNKVPKSFTFHYVKINKTKVVTFTEQELIDYEKYVVKLSKEIMEKGIDINKYSIGNIGGIFNSYRKGCERVKMERELKQNENEICYKIYKNKLVFNNLPEKIVNVLNNKYSYLVDGYQWSDLYKKKIWDGKKYFLKETNGIYSLPLAFIHDLKRLIRDYNEYYNKSYNLRFLEDARVNEITHKTYNTQFKEIDFKLYPYQEEAIAELLKKKIGIINLGTGLGKTILCGELLKKINRRSLFLINRLELVEQTHEVFEENMGVEIGKMSEGNIDIDKQITIASIQTVYEKLKRKDKDVILYLNNITCIVFDECHSAGDSKMYNLISQYTNNLVFSIGLTGTAFRNGPDTLEMNSLVGFPEYIKTTKQGIDEDYLVPVKCKFFNYNNKEIDEEEFSYLDSNNKRKINYPKHYEACIVNDDKRNKLIVDKVKELNKKTIILVSRVKHGQILSEQLDCNYIHGSLDKEERKKILKDYKENIGSKYLVANIKILGTGINIVDLDCVFNTCAGKSSIDAIQTIGRVMRKSEEKECGYYLDIKDNKYFYENSAKERIKILKKFEHLVNVE